MNDSFVKVLMLYAALALVALVAVSKMVLISAWWIVIRMPGKSFRGEVPELNAEEVVRRKKLERDLTVLAKDIGERNVSHRYDQLLQAGEFLEQSLRDCGYQTQRQELVAAGKQVWNVFAESTGTSRPHETVVIGAHYDTVPGSPGANDNGSAVVATLELARVFARVSTPRTVRFAFFVNEESPYYMTEAMGSLRHAQQSQADGDNLVGMISLETIGCYVDGPRTQRYPLRALGYLYPRRGNFIAFVGNVRSRRLVRRAIRGFRGTSFPSEGLAAPNWLKDIFRSDHAAFWDCGYPAIMVTDTANFRYPHYHTAEDSVDKINFVALSRVVTGLCGTVHALADVE